MRYFITFLVTICMLLSSAMSQASSYLYIQGDKKTSIYVKVEGQMMPRLGLHYALIPNLGPGDTRVEILFQENKYPAHQFVIRIPDDGARGFILTQVKDNEFALYDLQSKMYIPKGNKQDDAYVVAVNTSDSYFSKPNNTSSNTNTDVTPISTPEIVKEEEKKGNPRFLDEIDLNVKQNTKKKNNKSATKIADNTGIVKSDEPTVITPATTTTTTATCEVALPTSSFEDFAGKMYALNDDESKLKYLRKNATKHCFDTQQAGILAGLISGQSSRFETLQLLYPKIVDKNNYSNLSSLFTTDFMKDKFKSIIQ